MKISIKIPTLVDIKLYKVLLDTFLIFQIEKLNIFLKLPNNTICIKKQNSFVFSLKKFNLYNLFILRSFSLRFKSFLMTKQQLFCKKLLLKGLGFRILSVVQNDFLELKIGFSHFVKIKIPTSLNFHLYTNKNMLIIEGSSKDKVGNFANKIKSFRLPDNYKGKGIWYKKELKILKEIKKT